METAPREDPVPLLGCSIWLFSGLRLSFNPWFSFSFVDPREIPPSLRFELFESNDF